MRHPAARLAAVTSWALLALAVAAGPASAHTSPDTGLHNGLHNGLGTRLHTRLHTSLKAAAPAIGSTVSSPSRIVLTFADPVGFPQVVLTDTAGRRHESGRARAVDETVTEQVAGPLAPGVYTVGWRVVAADGHPVSGTYRFGVRGAPGAGAVVDPGVGATPRTASPETASTGAGWWWAGLGALLLAGGAAGVVLARRRPRRDDRA